MPLPSYLIRSKEMVHTSDQIDQVFHTYYPGPKGVKNVFTFLDLLEQIPHTFSDR